ncbi:hypothetical protein P171DRAFT_434986 [Karstenula rhodostoma CBS 690.94]|uniref:Uncharacterized protein n=1 Tax=Karstenula rhodostoma CBS 690.94 TaxID=1392251 RepID=A0A9P4U8K8_9PLEO|nr:hypothetical protein P171DRAFT_434986 [Karstenula rhodostoma CBS 690.94]
MAQVPATSVFSTLPDVATKLTATAALHVVVQHCAAAHELCTRAWMCPRAMQLLEEPYKLRLGSRRRPCDDCQTLFVLSWTMDSPSITQRYMHIQHFAILGRTQSRAGP